MGYPIGPTVGALALAMVLTSILAIEARNLYRAAVIYIGQALLLCGILATFGRVHPPLYIWAVTAFVTKAVIVPWALLWTISKTKEMEAPPLVGPAPSVVIASLVLVAFYKLTHTYVHFLAPTPQAQQEPFRTVLAVSLSIFTLGIYGILTRRDAIKTVVATCLLENAVHLSLVSLAPGMRETVIIGIVTDVVVGVLIWLYLIRGIYEVVGDTDTFKLSELHW